MGITPKYCLDNLNEVIGVGSWGERVYFIIPVVCLSVEYMSLWRMA